ncbi:MAG: hypothetical protein GF344_11855 [Chitinivibrionales bacterium]|nr:hypothetical protein [Chitinivibrionales bacterium]MBD3357480.1 hypothetical protein [Chitinivibrionales bacterium]
MKISFLHGTRWKIVWVLISLAGLVLLAIALGQGDFRADCIRTIAILLDSKASAAAVAGLAACLGMLVYHWIDVRRRKASRGIEPRTMLHERHPAFVDEALALVHRLEDQVYLVLSRLERKDRESMAVAQKVLSESDDMSALSHSVRRVEIYLPPRMLVLATKLDHSWKELLQKCSPEVCGEVHRALADFRNALRGLIGTESPSYSLQVAFNEIVRD